MRRYAETVHDHLGICGVGRWQAAKDNLEVGHSVGRIGSRSCHREAAKERNANQIQESLQAETFGRPSHGEVLIRLHRS